MELEPNRSKVTSKGQIVIPKQIRLKYGITSSTVINWIEKPEGVMMVPDSEDPIVKAKGMFKQSGMIAQLLEERRAEREKEDATGGEFR